MPAPEPPAQEEVDSSAAILILLSMLFFILMTSYMLQRKKIRIIHETVVSIILGMVVGFIIRYSETIDEGIMKMVTFDHRYFFNLLLPPIILNSGYDMHRQNFFKNFGAILIFALGGTIISTLVIGSLFYLFVSLGLHGLKMSFLDCVLMGSILSSTDPVTVLSLFHQLQVDEKLYAIIFGESLLNDSVAIVLFSTLGKLRNVDWDLGVITRATLSFFAVFSGSIMIGVVIGIGCALLLKYTHLEEYPTLETCMIVIQAYGSYMLSNALQFSGIVSLLFCGIIMKHYASDNMSPTSKHTTKNMFQVLSQLSENFIFIYLGVALFTKTQQTFLIGFILLSLVTILIARYISVIPLAWIINSYSRWRDGDRDESIPRNHQLMIWWAGLRGAIAFALSFEVEGDEKSAIQTTILMVCVISVIVLGGTTPFALKYLEIKTGVKPAEEEEEDEVEMRASFDSDILPMRPSHWFLTFDQSYLKPMFMKDGRLVDSPSRGSLLP